MTSTRKVTALSWGVTFLTLALSGCGSNEEAAQAACEDVKKAFFDSTSPCFESSAFITQEEYEALLDVTFECSKVKDLRDEDELYDECIPGIEALECSDLVNLDLPESCEGQLLQER